MKRTEFLTGTLASLALLSLHGCFTPKLYEKHETEYEEIGLSFLVTEDGSKVVVLGKNYHYIFHDITPSLKELLTSPLRKVVAADLSKFYVRRDNVVTGVYTVSLVPEASDEERRSAVAAGFVTPELTLSGHLEGLRYSAENFPQPAKTQEFTRPYVVSIREQESSSRVAGKILLTPIAVAADGVLILGGLVLILLILAAGGPRYRSGEKRGGMRRWVTRLVWMGALALALAGCATSTALSRAEKPRPLTPGASILLMKPDVELYEVTAGGLLEPKADWTAAANDNVTAALTKAFEAKRVTVVSYAAPSDPSLEQTHVQLTKLHERVGSTIITFRYGPALRLPGKGEVFDWTLGGEAKTLAGSSGAEYALFIRFLDSYASGGRVAMITVFALLGVGLPGGTQVGFASLVDLRTGDLVWFNRLVNPAGDLRTPERAREAVQALLADLPL